MPTRTFGVKQIQRWALGLQLVVLVAGFGVWTASDFRDAENQATEEVTSAALLLEEHVLRSLEAIDGALLQTADLVQELGAAALPSEAAWRRLRSIARPLPISSAIFIYDRNGDTIGSSAAYPFPQANRSDREYFQELMSGRSVHTIGRALRGRSVHNLFFPIARSIQDAGGRVEAVVQIGVEVDYIADLFTRANLRGKAFGLYRASDGALVARHPVDERLLDETIGAEPYFVEITGGSPMWTGWMAAGEGRRLLSVRRVGELPLVLTASMPYADVFGEAFHHLGWRILGLLVAAAAMATLGIMLLRSAQREARTREQQERAEQDLKASEQRFRMALRNAPVSVAVQNRALTYVWAYNQRTARPEEIIGRRDDDIFTPEEAARITPLKQRVIEDGIELREQMWLDRPGGPMFLDIYWEPIRDESGRVSGVGSATVDLTPMKKAEEALRRSEERYRKLFNSLIEGFCIVEMIFDGEEKPVDYRFLEVNPMFETLTGLKDVQGRRIREILPGNEAHWYEVYGQVALTGEPARFGGKAEALGRWFEVNAYRVEDPERRRVAILFNDVTERKRAETALKESEERLRLALDAAYLISFEWDIPRNEVRRFTSIEPSLTATSQDRPGTFEEVCAAVHPDDCDAFIANVHAALERPDGVYENEYRVVRPGGDGAWLYERGRVERDDTGRPLRLIGLSQDITARKQAEAAVRDAKDNLERIVAERTAELYAANRELEQRAGQLRLLAGELTMAEQRERKRLAKVLHDGLQQYLVAAKLQVGGLVQEIANADAKQTVSTVESLLSESIMVSRSLAAELSPPILHEAGILAGIEWLCRWMAKAHGLHVDLVVDMEPPILSEDVKVLLFESVRELLLNIVKHAQVPAARVHVGPGGRRTLRIAVSDAGRGFDPAAVHPGAGGGGFGLFSIRERLGLVGGRFESESAPGRGARFVLTAPTQAPQADVPSPVLPSPEPRVPAPAQAAPGGGIRILLVDDHAVMREGLARLLGQEIDFEVVGEASDGQDAVVKAGALYPDVILMDISMPVLNGIEATHTIHRQYPGIQVIGLSLYSEEERAREMLEAGAAYYMTKSGPATDLKAAIRACMQDHAPAAAPYRRLAS